VKIFLTTNKKTSKISSEFFMINFERNVKSKIVFLSIPNKKYEDKERNREQLAAAIHGRKIIKFRRIHFAYQF